MIEKKIDNMTISLCAQEALNENTSAYFFGGGVGGQQNKTLARHRCGRTGRAPLGNKTEAGNGDLFLSQSLGWTVVWLVCAFFFLCKLVI